MKLKVTLFSTAFVFVIIYRTILAGGNPKIMTTAPSNSAHLSLTEKEIDNSNNGQINWYQMFTRVPSDYYSFVEYSLSPEEINTIINLSIMTGSLMVFDQYPWKFQHDLYSRSTFDRKASNIAVQMGNGNYQLALSAVFALGGIIFHKKNLLKTAGNIMETILSTGLFVQMLKRITGRESPAASTESGGDWELLPGIKQYQNNQPRYYSFPSGHLSTTAAIITVIENNYPDEKWLRPVGYSVLGVLGFSLVSEGMHWYSDLPLAYFIGCTFGNIIAPIENSNQNNKSIFRKHFLLTPYFNINGVALNAIYSF